MFHETNLGEVDSSAEVSEAGETPESTETEMDDDLASELDNNSNAYLSEADEDSGDAEDQGDEEDDDENAESENLVQDDSKESDDLETELDNTYSAYLKDDDLSTTEAAPDQTETQGRRIPGTPGIVTGGDSQKLGKNMLEDMGVERSVKWGSSGYQAHHIIPKEFASHPVIKKIGMDMDDASNGIFLRKPSDGINVKAVHYGNHEEYSRAVSKYLDSLDPNQSVEELESKVADLQQNLKKSLENGTPLYKSKGNFEGPVTYRNKGGGATQDMWEQAINKK